jgi:hypothetical protein
MRQNRPFLWLLTGFMMLLLICAGCGKKGDPMPLRITMPTITDLGARSLREGIVLGWSLIGSTDSIDGFKIFRSETSEPSRVCPGCPQDYRPFGTVTLADDRLKREGEKRFRYVDTDVRAGGFYSYRIAVCSRAGYCGKESNASGVIHTDR